MADEVIKGFAKALRHNQTDAEKKIWRYLRSREFEGIKFRRQQPVGPYIADFCSFEKRTVIELDGGQHALAQQEDAERTKYFQKSGFKVIRVWNNEVMVNIQDVLEHIRQNLR